MPPKISRSDLLAEIRRLKQQHGEPPTRSIVQKHGKFSRSAYKTEFGSLIKARKQAGLQGRQMPRNVPTEELLSSLVDFADQLDKTPSAHEMDTEGPHSSDVYQSRFGSWNDALRSADLPVNRTRGEQEPVECDHCGKLVHVFPSETKSNDHHFCNQDCRGSWLSENAVGESHPQYERVKTTCRWCGSELIRKKSNISDNFGNFCNQECLSNWISHTGSLSGENNPRWSGGKIDYGRGWTETKRKRVRERDGHICQSCGMSQQQSVAHSGRKLDVHHIIPARQFDDPSRRNATQNLVTLCRECHRRWEGIPLRPQFSGGIKT